eukprot:COSAG02_NODE_4627_length_5151_cov_2.807601_6_plen_43_part_01
MAVRHEQVTLLHAFVVACESCYQAPVAHGRVSLHVHSLYLWLL